MGVVIDFRTARPVAPLPPVPCMCCRRCGADVWSIAANGEVRCADCEEPCPYRLQIKNDN